MPTPRRRRFKVKQKIVMEVSKDKFVSHSPGTIIALTADQVNSFKTSETKPSDYLEPVKSLAKNA